MIKSIVVYAAVFFLTLYCFFLYDDAIIGAMLVAEIVYLIFALVNLSGKKKKIRITMEPLVSVAEKNQEIHLRVKIQNRSKFFPAYVRIRLQIENAFTREKSRGILSGTVPAGEYTDLSASFRTGACGNLRVMLERYWIYDILHLMRCVEKGKEVQQIGILPECHLVPVEVTRRTREFIADAEEYSDRESGDDPSEVYQVRAYREKDSIHNIHWKLSAKADELLVKEHGKPLGAAVLIWLNLEEKKNAGKKTIIKYRKKRSGKMNSVPADVLELAASLSFSLLEEKCVHMVAWYEPENHRVCKKTIRKEEHIYELLTRLLFVKACKNKEEMNSQYEEAFRGENFSTIVEISTDGSIKVGEETFNMSTEEFYFTV